MGKSTISLLFPCCGLEESRLVGVPVSTSSRNLLMANNSNLSSLGGARWLSSAT
jgi:hypothetical protein